MAVYAMVIAAIFIGELLIKNYVERNVEWNERIPILRGRIIIRKYYNKGAFLDLGEKRSRLVAAVSVMLSIAMTTLFVLTFSNKGSRLLKAGLSILLGGAYSNTYDRLKRKYVVDYFSFGAVPAIFQKNPKQKDASRSAASIVYNISDFCVLIGALCIVLGSDQSA